jgi:Tfp pilus assembly protein PilZ
VLALLHHDGIGDGVVRTIAPCTETWLLLLNRPNTTVCARYVVWIERVYKNAKTKRLNLKFKKKKKIKQQ